MKLVHGGRLSCINRTIARLSASFWSDRDSSEMRLCLTFFICLTVAGRIIPHNDKNIILLTDELHRSTQNEDAYLRFPDGFKLGASGSSYQIEGGWNASDKGESVWDRLLHTQPWRVAEGSNADVTCDSYHKYREDVYWIKQIGLDHYRFSISWPRVLPNGFPESVSQDGLQYYHNLVDELLANGIEPIVTLYHRDHPQVLEDMGGWHNESMIDWFADYANVIFRELGPKVKIFMTLNEPDVICTDLPHLVVHRKEVTARDVYLCGQIALKAHARAYHLYDKEYRPTQQGEISIVSSCNAYLPKFPNETLAAEISFQFSCGWMSHPIFVGDYSEMFKARIAELNRDAPSESRLPELSSEWIEYINGTADYFGLNHFTSFLVETGDRKLEVSRDIEIWNLPVTQSADPSWEFGMDSLNIQHVPEGFGTILRKIKDEYNNPLVYVMENGFPENAPLNDYRRIKYIYSYLKELLLAVNRDGCNVKMYTVWSLLDNFEWTIGYSPAMGLINVDFTSPNRDRSPKLSASWLRNVTLTRRLQPPVLPPVNPTGHL